MNARTCILLTSAFLFAAGAVGANSPVFAQPQCAAQVSYPVTATTQYYAYNYNDWNIRLNVPVTVTCQYAAGQLYAAGNAYDPVLNTNVGSANTLLAQVNGGYFNGQLSFQLPPAVLQHQLQMSVFIYSNGIYGYYNGLVASTSFTVTIHPAYQNNNYGYPGYNNRYIGPNCYENRYPYMYYYNGYYYYYYSDCYYGRG